MSVMIDIQKLRKEFGSFVAVDGVSFQVRKGEVLGFLGPNGAGKSTTMKMITGFLPPTAGSAIVCGHDILKEPQKVKARIGYLPEGAPAYPDMTPASFLKFIAEVRGYRGAEAKRRIDEAVQKTSLESHYYVQIDTLSKGFKRRVGLAQAILHDPEVLIMDEPTDGLDPNQKFEVRNLIAEMAKEKSIILSTHILEEVEAVCTRAVIIAAGKVIADGTPEQLCARSNNHNAITVRIKGISEADGKEALARVNHVTSVEAIAAKDGISDFLIRPIKGKTILSEVNDCLKEKNWDVSELRVERGRLDEVFRDLTGETTIKAGRQN